MLEEVEVVEPATNVRTVARCECTVCGKFFVGATVFDAHRMSDPKAKFGRRCMTTTEMQNAGLATEKRLVRFRIENKPVTQEHDVWYLVQNRQR